MWRASVIKIHHIFLLFHSKREGSKRVLCIDMKMDDFFSAADVGYNKDFLSVLATDLSVALSDRLRQTAIRHVPVVNDKLYDILNKNISY